MLSSADVQSIIIALSVVATSTYFIYRYYNGEIDGVGKEASWPFKKLKQNGCFNYTWAAKSTAVEERKSDSCRLAETSDLLVATPGAPKPEVWKKIMLTTADSAKSDDETEGRPTKMFQTLEAWLRLEIKTAGGDPTATLSKHVAEFLSVTPAISFVLAHGIPPQILQAKYILVVGKSGDVRVLWYGFITDKVMPGAVAGPFLLRLLSPNLNSNPLKGEKERKGGGGGGGGESPPATITYSVQRSTETEMSAVLAEAVDAIRASIDTGNWTF